LLLGQSEGASTAGYVRGLSGPFSDCLEKTERKQTPSVNGDTCYRCQREGHSAANCKYKDFQCRACNKKGHLERACRNASQRETYGQGNSFSKQRAAAKTTTAERGTPYVARKALDKGPGTTRLRHRSASPNGGAAHNLDVRGHHPETENCANMEAPGVKKDFGLFSVKGDSEYVKPYMVMIRCNGVKIKMEVDTGAAMSIISEKLYKRRFNKCKLQPCDVSLKTYSSEPIVLLGEFQVTAQCRNQTERLTLLVSKGSGPTLMGRNWIQYLHLDWSRVNHVPVADPLTELREKYSQVFNADRGVISGVKAKLRVMENAKPKFCKARSVPYML